jgi:hypothetical protein
MSVGPQLTQVHLGTSKFSFVDALHRVTSARLRETPVNILRDLSFGSVGILWLLPFFALRTTVRAVTCTNADGIACSPNLVLLARFLPFLILTYLGWFMALNTDRRFAYAFPFWIMMNLNSKRSLAVGWNIDIVWFIPVFFIQYLLNLLQPLTPAVPVDIAIGTFIISLSILCSFKDRLGTVRS